MKRRDSALMLFALGAAVWPLRLRAQAPRRVGVLLTAAPGGTAKETFENRLKALGWEAGRNLTLIYLSADGKLDRLPGLAQELIGAKVEMVVTFLNAATLAVRRAAPSMPIVMAIGANPVAAGLVQSLAHPGGNITGMSFDAAPETYGKQLDILRALVPRARRIGVFWESSAAGQDVYVAALDQAARSVQIELRYYDMKSSDAFTPAFESMRADAAAGFVTIGGPVIHQWRKEITDLAVKFRLPGVWHSRVMVDAGGLIAYGPKGSHFWLRAAEYTDRILRGTKPADLPVQQPTEFDLVLNQRTAKALGLAIPPLLMLQITEVIE